MAAHVVLYLCRAKYDGCSEIEYAAPPEQGSEHDCILFVRQAEPELGWDTANEILAFYGWGQVEMKRGAPLEPESLNDPSMKVFQGNYEECLEKGDSLVWYP